MQYTVERWAFTLDELQNPAACYRDDMFIHYMAGVYVTRTGRVTNQYLDGSFGTCSDDQRRADSHPDDMFSFYNFEGVYCWRDVLVDYNGKFVEFMESLQ